ncbi:hypothetical protein OS42_18820 [Dickeya oryzae]
MRVTKTDSSHNSGHDEFMRIVPNDTRIRMVKQYVVVAHDHTYIMIDFYSYILIDMRK